MKYLIAVLMVLVMVTGVCAERDVASGGIRVVNDRDGLQLTELFTGYQHNYNVVGEFVGVEVGKSSYEDVDGEEDFNYIRVEARKNIFQDTYIEGGIRYNKSGNWSPVTGDVAAVWKKDPVRVEVTYKRSFVESQRSIQNEIIWNTYGVQLNYQLDKQFLLSGLVNFTDSDDGNTRTTEMIGLTYEHNEHYYVKTRVKWFQSKFDADEYWSPEKYQHYGTLFGYKAWLFDRMWLMAEAGPGYEVSDGEGVPTLEYQVTLNYDLNPVWTLKSYLGSVHVFGDETYRYSWLGASLERYFE